MKVPPVLNIRAEEQKLYKALIQLADNAEELFRDTYRSWELENVPTFQTLSQREGGNLVVYYFTEDTPYVWVDNGTDGPYTITAKNAPFLRFKVGGRPKSKPGELKSSFGRPGVEWRSAMSVEHPGIEPRDFSGQVAKRLDQLAPVIFSYHLGS